MKYFEQLCYILDLNQGIISSADCRDANIPTIYLNRMVKQKKLYKVARGIYSNNEIMIDDYYVFQRINERCIYSYQCALYFHDLTDRQPFKKEFTVYTGYNTSHIKEDVSIHYIKKELYEIGITEKETDYGFKVKTYNIERTICDLVKDRHKMDSEVFVKAIKAYVKRKDKNLNQLYEYAKLFDIEKEVNDIMVLMNE